MASSKARRRDRLSILDMSMEDDSLLPLPGSACATVHEGDELQVSETAQASQVAESRPPTRRNKKSGHANLRKSLAWDMAFLTGEGVLEPDELPMSTRPPKKLPDLPTLDIHATRSKLTDENEVPKPKPAAINLRSCSERFDNRSGTYPVLVDSQSDSSNLYLEAAPSVKQSATIVPRFLPAKKVIESAIQKGTRLRLPSTVTAEQKTAVPPLSIKQQKESSSLTKRVTLVSKKVKDTIGRVLPGRVATSTSGANSARTDACSVSDASDSMASVSTSDSSSKKEKYTRSYSAGSRLMSSTEDSRPKPTGLRLPSPKLGFFDPGRPLHASQCVKSNASSGTKHAIKSTTQVSCRSKPHGLPKGKFVPTVSSAIPSAPQHHKDPCCSAPSTPRKSTNELLSPSARFAASNSSLTPKGKGLSTRGSFKSLRKLEMNSAAGSEEDESCDRRMSGAQLVARKEEESLTKIRSPLAVLNAGPDVIKEKESFFSFAKKAVGLLPSSVEVKAAAANSEIIPIPSSKEEKLVKTGRVQHSPPNKEPGPQLGPWSPVRKNGTQLGPFDCTKSNAQALEWEAS